MHPPEPGAEFNLVESVICRRRSVRFYLQKQVPEYLVRRVLEAGRFAPSAGNAQPWKYIVLQDRAMMAEMEADVVRVCRLLTRFAYYMVPGSEHKEWRAKLLMRLSPNNFHPIPFTAMKLIAEGKLGVWHKAPTVIVLLADMRSPGFPVLDIGITGQNMVLAAHSYGLGTCWVSFVKPLAYYRKWRKRLGIRYPYKLVTSIAVGYPRGIPDGEVDRETRAIDWYGEDGSFRTVF
ncbi:MAG: nitroreductase family protein [Nitrospirae bacterium]|nr:nitroreductase family protein [Nitrospirota bacterium]